MYICQGAYKHGMGVSEEMLHKVCKETVQAVINPVVARAVLY